jgi:site-specific DNA recombinase
MKRFAIYARYSSDKQNESSIADQLRVCADYVERRARGAVVATYTDAAVSGAHTAMRPQYQQMLRDAEAGLFDCIIAEDTDRLSRDMEESARLLKHMTFRGIEVHTVHGGRVGKLDGGIKALMSDVFLDQLREKTKRGMVGAFERGGIPCGLCYGYRTGAAPSQRVIDLEQAAIVRRIYTEFANGIGADEICRRLNAEGVRTGRNGKLWRGSTLLGNPKRLNGILNNPIYTGRIAFGRQSFVKDPTTGKRQARLIPREQWLWRDFPHLQIVPPDLYDAAQAQRRGVPNKPRTANRPKSLLSGLIHCGVCDGPMVKQDRWFRCPATRTAGCSNGTGLPVAYIEGKMLAALQAILRAPEMRKQFINEHRQHLAAHRQEIEREQRALAKRQDAIGRKINRLVEAIENGTDLPSVRDKLRQLEAERATLAPPPPRPAPTVSVWDAARSYYEGLAQLSDLIHGDSVEAHQAREAIRGCITRVVSYPGKSKDGNPLVEAEGDLAAILGLAADGADVSGAVGCGGQI